MNKFKKFLSLSFIGAAALSMTAGACFLIHPTHESAITQADTSSSTISNQLPSYIKTEGLTTNSTYFSKELPLVFNAESIRSTTTDEGQTSYLLGYYPNINDKLHYYLFSDINITVKINGKVVTYKDTKGKDTSIDSSNYKISSTEAIKGTETYPEIFAMKIERGTTFNQTTATYNKETNSFTPGVLTLAESGLLEVTVSYGIYGTTLIPGKNYDKDKTDYTESTKHDDNETSVFTGYESRSFTYTAFLFDSNEYFEPDCQDGPNITFKNLDRRASNSSSTYKWEYFYNYETAQLPSITYNANHVRLTITKNYNNNTESTVLNYNPDTQTITMPSFVKDVVVAVDDEGNHNATVYFNDVGVYDLHYDLIYNYQSEESGYIAYKINQPIDLELDGSGNTTTVLDQKLHILGAQISYTDYTDNQFKEFKKFDTDNHTISKFDSESNFVKSADVSYLFNSNEFTSWKETTEHADKTFKNYLLTLTPVSTNQTPLKLTTNLNSTSGTFELYKLNGTSWEKDESFSLTKNISASGTYLIAFENFVYDGFTAEAKTYNQYFYFKINKTTPDVGLKAIEKDGDKITSEKILYTGEYTNKLVQITYNEIQNDFDAPVRFELIRYNFNNNTTEAAKNITFDNNGEYLVEDNGRYTLNIYYGKQSLALTPITKTFIIDKQNISGLASYAVETSGINSDYKTSCTFNDATNQPFVFTWQNEKASGAHTYGYYKYFPLSSINYYSGKDNSKLITNLLNNGILATDYQLSISGSGTWDSLSNAEHLIKSNTSIPSNYVNERAGLYIFQIFDQAGNSAVSTVLYDDSKPYFALFKSGTGYSLITSNYTLTTDASLCWADKAIKIYFGEGNSDLSEDNLKSICTNKNGIEDETLTAELNNFLNKVKSYTNLGSDKNGKYYISPINSEIAYKDRINEKYELVEMSKNENHFAKEIQFSYTIHYTIDSNNKTTYYISTSNSSTYKTMDGTEIDSSTTGGVTWINGNELFTADIYMTSGDNGYEYYYGIHREDAPKSISLISLTGATATATLIEGDKYKIGNKTASKVSFVDMEGTYVFLIRDASNTQGANLSQDQKYLRYASNYQYIKVLSDSSQMSVYFKNDDEEISLSDATFTKIESIEAEGSNAYQSKSSYFNPTSVEETLYVSFIPTIKKEGSSDATTQVKEVILTYYQYETKATTKLDINGNPYFAFYRTLSSIPVFENKIYDVDIDGESESKIEKTINIDKNMTKAGKYILTRTYVTGDSYTIDVFDYYKRSLTTLVDRYGVLTSPETISHDKLVKYYNGKTITATKYGNVVIVSDTSDTQGKLNNSNISIYVGDTKVEPANSYIQNNQVYFVFDNEISDDFELKSNSEAITITYDENSKTETIGPSFESIVGGDIFINMYDDIEDNSVISVTFPYYKEDGLNSGNSLYTSNNTDWSADSNVTSSLRTNKLPLKLYIPEVKYTIANEEKMTINGAESYFENTLNDALTYFDTDENFKNTSAITAYQLVASVEFMPDGENNSITYTSVAGKNGFLGFVDEDGNEIENFYKAGMYTVTITQGYYSDSNSLNNFRKNYKFGFVIESSAPEFNISADGKQLETLDEINYYTSKNKATVSWKEDTDDRYIAKIDKANIDIEITKSTITYSKKIQIKDDNTIESNDKGLEKSVKFEQSGKTNILTIDLESLGIYNNNDKIAITMQFEGHNDNYYKKTTKTIVVDKQASNENVNLLINKLAKFDNSTIPLTDSNLRDYCDAYGTTVDSAEKAAYNFSKALGYLKYYAYQVDNSFFQMLKSLVAQNKSLGTNYRGETIAVYYREIDYSKDFNETKYDNFIASNFSDISLAGIPNSTGYFEIVEQDLAGNLTIYIVHKYSTEDEEQGISFNDSGTDKLASDEQILSNKLNLYSSTNFSLNWLNFMGDKWAEINIGGDLFMLSPWLEEGKAYRLSGSNAEEIELNSIFKNFNSSTTPIDIFISNGASGEFASFKLTLLDGAKINTYLSESTSEEFISVKYSNYVYPVKVVVYNGTNQIYTHENNPNSLENLNDGYSYLSNWTSTEEITVTTSPALSSIQFAFTTLPSPNSKIKYEITDNFGNVIKVTHIYGQNLYQEIQSSSTIYTNLINDETTNYETETYYISSVDLRFSYNNIVHSVKVYKWDGKTWSETDEYTASNTSLTTLTFANKNGEIISNKYKIDVYEYDEENPTQVDENQYVKTIYFHIYNTLPLMDEAAESYFKLNDNYGQNITNSTLTDTSLQRVTIDNRIYTITRSGSTFANTVIFTFTNSKTFDYPFSVYYYKENGESSGFIAFKSGTVFNESGIYYFLIKYDEVLTSEYKLYKLEILDSATEFYRVTNNGKQVEKAGSYYYYNGTEYSEYYIVNVDYNTSSSLVQIVPNNYQKIEVSTTYQIKVEEGDGVVTLAYRVSNYDAENSKVESGISAFNRLVFITFIPPTDTPVSDAFFTLNSADEIDMLTSSSIIAPVGKENTASESLKLIFSRSYGIENNTIKINVVKDGILYPVEIKTLETTSSEGGKNKAYSYVELTTSGTYTITLSDVAGNKQIFAAKTSQASQTLKLIFLKDVAFTMTYTDANGNEHTTDPIQKGVFNRKVSITLLNTSEYYTAAIGSGQNMITATRNGEPFTEYEFDADSKTFTFDKPGYYSVYFTATSTTGIEIREEVYNFTIVNPEESRYSFEFAPYDGYYIKSISKDNVGDITRNTDGSLKQEFKDSYQTVIVEGKEYLKNITTSFLDSLTGEGRYTITINTTKKLNRTDYTTETEFSFNYWINTKTVPISVSVIEGESTSKDITVSFNADRVYESVGECVVIIGSSKYEINSDTINSLGVVTATLSTTGTYFITVRSTSGNLLYSYKVIKNEPLNSWAIIAICIGGVAAIVVVVIIVKLRKRIKVK